MTDEANRAISDINLAVQRAIGDMDLIHTGVINSLTQQLIEVEQTLANATEETQRVVQQFNQLNTQFQATVAEYEAYKLSHPVELYRLGGKKVFALQQIETIDDLPKVATWLDSAISAGNPIGGLCIRMGWKQYVANKSVLDSALQVARARDLVFSFRFMAGRFTPPELMGNTALLDGEPIPLPFTFSGTPNLVFEDAYRVLVEELVRWYEANDCHLLHCSWYAGKWSELNNGLEVQNAPGYSPENFVLGHLRLIDIVSRAVYYRPVVAEFPVTGRGPNKDVSIAINQRVVDDFGAGSRRAALQLNGWAYNDVVGGSKDPAVIAQLNELARDPRVVMALQAIQPWGQGKTYPQYTAEQVISALQKADGINAQYVELYLPTLTAENGGKVWATPLQDWLVR